MMIPPLHFLDFSPNRENAEFVILGAPYDGEMTQDRGKCINAPEVIRRISLDLSLTSENGTDLNTLHIVDGGDLPLDLNSSSSISETITPILQKFSNVIPVFIGGSHLISYYTVNSLLKQNSLQNLHYFSFDAHLDCYDEWNGNKYTHCTVTRRIFERLHSNPNRVQVIGARDIDLPELEWVEKVGLNFIRMDSLMEENILINDAPEIKPPAYISVDIDVFDPSIAPGTGYPIPGGLTYREYLHLIEQIMSNYTIVGIDFVEFSPELDPPNKMTAFLVAKLIIETITKIKQKKK